MRRDFNLCKHERQQHIECIKQNVTNNSDENLEKICSDTKQQFDYCYDKLIKSLKEFKHQ